MNDFIYTKRHATLHNVYVGPQKYNLSLRIGELVDLSELTTKGPVELLERFLSGRWIVTDLRHTIRLGLYGAGMDAERAETLVDRFVVSGDLAVYVKPAARLVGLALQGDPEDKVGEPASGEAEPAENPPAE